MKKKKYSKIYEPKINLIISTVATMQHFYYVFYAFMENFLTKSIRIFSQLLRIHQITIVLFAVFDFRYFHIKIFRLRQKLKLLLLSMVKNSFTKEVSISRI